ncbi:MAG: hypothetical protein WCV84_04350 [Patescibacteria group bacterium]
MRQLAHKCGATPECRRIISRIAKGVSRRIGDVEVCQACYQRTYALAKKMGLSKEEVLRNGLPALMIPLPRIATVCSRSGCSTRLRKGGGPNVRRTIGLRHVCRNCYQTTWEYANKHNVTLEEALRLLKPLGWKSPPPPEVRCSVPWCAISMTPSATNTITESLYACGACRAYLLNKSKRPPFLGKTLADMVEATIKGHVHPPGTKEPCAMPWCNRKEVIRHRGPHGEFLCWADAHYLMMYRKRHHLTHEQAFLTAPQPRRFGPART